MRALRTSLALAALLAFSSIGFAQGEAPVAEAVPATGLDTIAICEDVAERVPVGEADSFPNSVGKLYCFTRVLTDEAPTQVFHRWYVGDKMVDEIPINVKGDNWRCWSTKTIYSSWDGPCRVEILTEEGDVIGTREFTLIAVAAAPDATDATDTTDEAEGAEGADEADEADEADGTEAGSETSETSEG